MSKYYLLGYVLDGGNKKATVWSVTAGVVTLEHTSTLPGDATFGAIHTNNDYLFVSTHYRRKLGTGTDYVGLAISYRTPLGVWVDLPLPSDCDLTNYFGNGISGIYGVSSTEIYVTGCKDAAGSYLSSLWRWDGVSWSSVAITAPACNEPTVSPTADVGPADFYFLTGAGGDFCSCTGGVVTYLPDSLVGVYGTPQGFCVISPDLVYFTVASYKHCFRIAGVWSTRILVSEPVAVGRCVGEDLDAVYGVQIAVPFSSKVCKYNYTANTNTVVYTAPSILAPCMAKDPDTGELACVTQNGVLATSSDGVAWSEEDLTSQLPGATVYGIASLPTPVPPLPDPVSDEWPCLDLDDTNLPSLFSYPKASSNRGAPWIQINGSNELAMYSDDLAASWFRYALPFQKNFTLEVEFKPSSLPDDLLQLDRHRFFVAAFDKQGPCGGILISRSGVALVPSYGTSVLALAGSQNIFEEGEDPYTMRITVSGDTNVMNIYVTKSEYLPIIGHQLRYTSPVLETPFGTTDRMQLEVCGSPQKPVSVKFLNLRAHCTVAVVPNQRPIADAGADRTSNIGSAVAYDGTASYDPEGAVLTYRWALTDTPDGSRFKISGAAGSTSDDGDADGFTPVFDGGPDAFSVDNAPLLQPGDHLITENEIYVVSDDRWVLDPETNKYARDPLTWVDSELVIDGDLLPDFYSGVAWRVCHSSTYFIDTTQPVSSAIPDISGLYEVQLIVNDGELDSLPSSTLLNVSQTSVILGCTPDVSWLWNLLSDFWNLLEDREIVETAWSGFAQSAAAQLLTAWQIDYNKSLIDIQRVFQRRWLSYDTFLNDNPETATIKIVRGPILTSALLDWNTIVGKTLQVVLDAGAIQTVTFASVNIAPHENDLTPEQIAYQINDQLGFSTLVDKLATVVTDGLDTYVSLSYALLLRIRPGGTANGDLGLSTTDYMTNDLQGEGGPVASDKLRAFEATTPPVLDFEEEGVGLGDLLVMEDVAYLVQKAALETGPTPTEKRGLSLFDDLPEIETPSQYPLPWVVPSVVTSETLDFGASYVVPGDIARFELKNLATSVTTVVRCEIVGVYESKIGFDCRPLLEAYAGVPSTYQTNFLGITHVKYVPVDDLVVEIPRLQEIIKDPPQKLEQNTDFFVETVNSKAIRFRDGLFSYLNPPADTYWAEITYLDNRPTIEANFGNLVDFRVENLETQTENLDYLSAVRGLWWAYFGGPALSKVKTGVQILLGLPFSEANGIITAIEPNFSALEGRLIIQDSDNPTISRTYFYPLTAGLAINEATGLPYAEGDEVDIFAPLSGGVEVYDLVENPEWLRRYVSQNKFTELSKFFRFLVRADVDTFNLVNLVFAQDFVRKIKPSYTFPLFVMLKDLGADEIDVLDTLLLRPRLWLSDTFCSRYNTGSYRWDDTDESGNWIQQYDDSPRGAQFVFDTHHLLCPGELIRAHVSYVHPGGAGWFFDTLWAYDDGDRDGDTISDDRIPLQGPDSGFPPPYGPRVYTIHYDATVAAGTYHRERTLHSLS